MSKSSPDKTPLIVALQCSKRLTYDPITRTIDVMRSYSVFADKQRLTTLLIIILVVAVGDPALLEKMGATIKDLFGPAFQKLVKALRALP